VTTSGTSLESVVILVATVVGLFVGSFLNVVVYRAPLGLSVSTPRSFCPTCDRQLAWWENVPLLSWTMLRGRCHTCHEPISVRYPLVEASTAAVFGLVAWAWHGTLPTAGYCVLSATALAIALIEFGDQRSPLAVGATGTGLGAVLLVPGFLVVHRGTSLAWALLGLTIGTAAFGMLRARDPARRARRAAHRRRSGLLGPHLVHLPGRAVGAPTGHVGPTGARGCRRTPGQWDRRRPDGVPLGRRMTHVRWSHGPRRTGCASRTASVPGR
jgi:leader peptidase (prepilin peptidase)/N-methyltransferase